MLNPNKFITWMISILLAVCLLIVAVKITVNTKQIFYFDIEYLNIEEESELTEEEMKDHYDVLIDYLSPYEKEELVFPSLEMSEFGRIHFEDVKNIFIFLEYLLWISVIIVLPGIYFLMKQEEFSFLKKASWLLFMIPITLSIPFMVSFDKTFDIFHEIVFTNDYWTFSSTTDPVIDMLPEAFFMHMAIFIMILVTVEAVILLFIHKKLNTLD